jgi:hypothetical protein
LPVAGSPTTATENARSYCELFGSMRAIVSKCPVHVHQLMARRLSMSSCFKFQQLLFQNQTGKETGNLRSIRWSLRSSRRDVSRHSLKTRSSPLPTTRVELVLRIHPTATCFLELLRFAQPCIFCFQSK